MSWLRTFGYIAIVLAGLGLIMAVQPSLAVDVGAIAIAVTGVVILVVAYERYQRAKRTDRDQAELDAVEERTPLVTPGDRLDERWDEYRFEAAAAGTIAADRGISTADAINLLKTGEWTDDHLAAAYFSPTAVPRSRVTIGPIALPWRTSDPLTARSRAVRDLARRVGLSIGDEP